jgi:eukaryotic-like serine/threonine-protein kinase
VCSIKADFPKQFEGARAMTAEQAIRIGEQCDRFEWDWRKGARPRIERFVAAAPENDGRLLLEDLLRIELELRVTAGDRPDAAEYRERFPAETELIDRVLSELAPAEIETARRSVANYDLFDEIGRGRQGVVYRAHERGIVPLEVAVKMLGAGTVTSRDDAQRFIGEVWAMAQINHPHIVPYRGSGEDRGQLYYVMSYIRGSSLAKFLKDRGGPFPALEVAALMIPIVDAVRYLHTQDRPIVHRDLSPHNILLDETGKPYVADFGLAILIDGGRHVEAGACGTIPYIAPEQFDSRFGDVGTSSDIYSLGVIIYELIAGRPPFPRNRASILRTLDSDPLPPSRLRAGIPESLERICMKCLRKATRDRYSSADKLLSELNRFSLGLHLIDTPPHNPWQRFRDWARSEPALATRLAVIVACSAILWGYRLITGEYAPLPDGHFAERFSQARFFDGSFSVTAMLVWLNQAILLAWGLASWVFQRQLNRKAGGEGLQFGWRVVDVVALCLLIALDDAVMSPLTVAFAVLIVASAFWARADQIIQTTVLSMAGYIILALSYRLSHPELDRPYRHFHYLVGLALLGLMLTYQANRTRALARVCGATTEV